MRDGGEQEIEGKTFLIASGSVINLIDLPGLKEAGFLDSDTALNCERFPRSLIVLGGGAIALEFAHFYGALGVEVTILQRSNQVIKEADPDVAQALVSAFEKRGIKVICGTKLKRVERTADGKRVWYERDGVEEMVEAEEILYALGRRPAVDGLGLKEAGVKTDRDLRGGGQPEPADVATPYFRGGRRHGTLRGGAYRNPARRDGSLKRQAPIGG